MKYHYLKGVNVYRKAAGAREPVEYWHAKEGIWRQSTNEWPMRDFSDPDWLDSFEELLEHWSHDPVAVKNILLLV